MADIFGADLEMDLGNAAVVLHDVDVVIDDALSSTSKNPVQNKVVKAALDGKQNTLTAGQNVAINDDVISVVTDSTLSDTSARPIQNKVVKTALDGKQNTLTAGQNVTISGDTISVPVDSALSATSEKPVQNKTVKAALDGKQDKLTAGQNVTINGSTISADVDSAEIASNVTSWLDDNVTPVGSAVVVDSSLSIAGAAADAAAVGNLKSATNVEFGNIKTALDFTESLGEQLTRIANDDGYYWRYLNDAWQHTAGQFWHVETYEVVAGQKYSVTGNVYHPYVPVCIFVDANNNFIGSTEIFTDSTWEHELKTYDVVIPANCTQIYVNKFYNDQSAIVKPYIASSGTKTKADSAYASSLKYNNQACYITLDERYFSVAETTSGLDITLPYRFTLYYQSAKAAEIKNLASGVASITYSVANGGNLVFDLTDNTMKIWQWSDISPANKDNFILMASVGNKEINGGVLKVYWNYQLAKRSSSAYDSSLKYDNQACYISIDERYFMVKKTSTGLDITLPYRIYLFYESAKAAAIKTLVSDATTITYSVANGANLIFDLTDNTMKTWAWADISVADKDDFLLMAAVGNYEINGGLLKGYRNTYDIRQLETWKGETVPANYYFANDYLPTKAVSIRNSAIESTVTFAFITDVHVMTNGMNAFKLIKYLDDHTNAIPFVIFGGDIHASDREAISEVLADADTWTNEISVYGKDRVYQCKGNHDLNSAMEGGYVYAGLDAEYYYLRKPTEQLVDNPNDSTYYGDRTLFYSFDDTVNKIRYIVLDCYDGSYQSSIYWQEGVSRAQVDWLIERLNAGDGYHIVVVSHEASDSTLTNYVEAMTPIQMILEAFANHQTVDYTGQGVYVGGDFTETTNVLVCHLTGHAHTDESHVANGVLSIVTTCDALYPRPSAYGTVNEQAFDVFCINKTNRTIKAVRIGSGNDRNWTY